MKNLNYYLETMQKERPEPSHKYFAYHMKNNFYHNDIALEVEKIIKENGGINIHSEIIRSMRSKYFGYLIVFKATESAMIIIKHKLIGYDNMITVKDYYQEF